MIDFRYHLVSLVAVLLALGVGIVLGSGPLDEQLRGALQTQTQDLRGQQQDLRERIGDLQQEVAVGNDFAAELIDPMTAGKLDKRSVVVFALPGADKDVVDETARALERAGATVTATVGITDLYVDPTKAKAPLEDLALRLVPPGVEFKEGATPIDRVGTVLARATVRPERDDDPTVDQKAAEMLAGLQELGALQVTGEPGRRAQLAVVVAPPAPAGKDARKTKAVAAANGALLGLTAALEAGSRGTVVTGPPAAATGGGFLAAVRASKERAQGVSSIDIGDTTIGRIGLVLALVEQTRGAAGDYGAAAGIGSVLPDIRGSDGS